MYQFWPCDPGLFEWSGSFQTVLGQRHYLEMRQLNAPAMSLYKRHGFSVTRELTVLNDSASLGSRLPERVGYTSFSLTFNLCVGV